MKKKIISFALALCLTATCPISVFAETSESQEENLESQIAALKEQLAALQGELDEDGGNEVSASQSGAEMQEGMMPAEEAPAETGSVTATAGSGRRVLINEAVTAEDWGSLTVALSEFTDCVQAINAADDSLKITPASGSTLYHARMLYKALGDEEPYLGNSFSCKLFVDGTPYEYGRLMVESRDLDGSHHTEHEAVDLGENLHYLFNVEGSSMPVYGERSQNSDKEDRFFAHRSNGYGYSGDWRDLGGYYTYFEYAVEIPAEIAKENSGHNIILQFNMEGVEFYFQVM